MKHQVFAAVVAAVTMLGQARPSAQPATPPATAPAQAPASVIPPVYQVQTDANTTRDQLQDILRQYPPSVGEVLRRDPSLMNRADYLAPYPQLVGFLQAHPEISRNPAYYFGGYEYYERRQPMSPEIEALGVLLGGLAGFLGVGAFISIVVWLVRAVIQHRRWLRQSRVQSEIHTKLMDRMTTNEELLAYIQSPAGRRFLESAPIQQEAESPRLGAPVGPIIWSMMAGIVLATVGVGFRMAAPAIGEEARQAFNVVGTIILALGTGFIISSVMAYLVSSRLGLFPQRTTPAVGSDNA